MTHHRGDPCVHCGLARDAVPVGECKGAVARFEAKYIPEPNSGCWLWLGPVKIGRRQGYGQFTLEGKTVGAHRAAWRLFRGTIPDGLFVCHKCDVRTCVNPDHLFLGTHVDNMVDMESKGRGKRIALVDISGQRFGKFQVLHQDGYSRRGHVMWLCRCDCGEVRRVVGTDLRIGHTKSCRHCAQLPFAKLTIERARLVYATYMRTKKIAATARQFGINISVARDIAYGRAWKHATQGIDHE